MKKIICYISASSGDWGGASRVLFTNLKILNRKKYKPIVLLPHEGPILPLLNKLDIDYEIWGDMHEYYNIFTYIANIIKAIRFFRTNKIDLIHINHANYWRPAEVIAARILKIPIVTHYHVVITEPGPFVKYSSAIAAVSNYVAENSESNDVVKKVIHNSVELVRYDSANDIRSELGLCNGDIVVSFIGQIRKIKGIDTFIELAHRINNDNAKFIIVGECRDPEKFEGSYTEEMLKDAIGDNKRIIYIGYRSDVENIYKSSDIIVMPSRWDEPFGLINIEAGAARKPMVATCVGGIPEVIVSGENGYLAERDDINSLADKVQKLIMDEQLRNKIGSNARAVVEERFTDLPVRNLEVLYEQLIDRNMKL